MFINLRRQISDKLKLKCVSAVKIATKVGKKSCTSK